MTSHKDERKNVPHYQLQAEPEGEVVFNGIVYVPKSLLASQKKELVKKLENLKNEYPVDASPTTKEHEIRINWANPVVHQALDTAIALIQE